VALLVIPRSILSLIGSEYESAAVVLLVLAMSIIPSAITVNIISKLNNLGKSKMLILSGTVQIVTFFVSFFVLVPIYGTIGAAISILIAFVISSLLLMILSDHSSIKYIIVACLSVFAGYVVGYTISLITGYEQELLIMMSSVAVSVVVIIASKNMTIKETKFLVKAMLHKR